MRRNTRIIQIAGFKGLMLVIAVVSCLAAGFIWFPSILAMNLWNFIASKTYFMPAINIYQGFLLWACIGISLYIMNDREKLFFTIDTKRALTEEEVKKLMYRIKLQREQMLNPMILNSGNIKDIDKEAETKNDDKKENV